MVSLAQVVQSRLTVGCAGETVFRAFTVAGKEELTFLALAGKGVLFHLSELHQAFAVHHFHQCLFMNVAQLVFRKYKVVARIYVAVEFHDAGMSASLGHGADARLRTYPVGQGRVEQLDEEISYILAYPFVKQGAEEVSPLFR
jgi:hypothetical protein